MTYGMEISNYGIGWFKVANYLSKTLKPSIKRLPNGKVFLKVKAGRN